MKWSEAWCYITFWVMAGIAICYIAHATMIVELAKVR